jgi:Flp pilus assembly protein TadD
MKDQNEIAFKYLVKALKLAPEESPLWTNLGVLYRRIGLNDHAEMANLIALKYNPENNSALNNLAYLYKQTDKPKQAEYFENLSKSFQSKNPYYRYHKAKEAFENNQLSVALDHINYALSKKKKDPRFYLLIGNIYNSLGENEKAAKALELAKNLQKT